MCVKDANRELLQKSLFPFWFLDYWYCNREEGRKCDYRFTCTCIGFFYVKYIEPVY